jgi:hypothetical protein
MYGVQLDEIVSGDMISVKSTDLDNMYKFIYSYKSVGWKPITEPTLNASNVWILYLKAP